MGWINVIATVAGLRTSSATSYCKISQVSRTCFIAAPPG